MTLKLDNREVRRLLDRLCGQLGFCLPPLEIERLAMDPPTSPAAFTDEVIRTEGMDPVLMDADLYRQVHDRVVVAFRDAAAAHSDH